MLRTPCECGLGFHVLLIVAEKRDSKEQDENQRVLLDVGSIEQDHAKEAHEAIFNCY